MSVKDINKVSHSIFVVAIALIVLVGAGVLILVSNENGADIPIVTSGNTRSVTGITTEVVEDCVRVERLVDGEVVASDAVICDGGSSLTVDGITVATSSGFTLPEESFYEDISQVYPGDTVEVVYQENENGGLDVNCDECGVREL